MIFTVIIFFSSSLLTISPTLNEQDQMFLYLRIGQEKARDQ